MTQLKADQMVHQAILRERERCARIAETYTDGAPIGGCDGDECGPRIAAKIREAGYGRS